MSAKVRLPLVEVTNATKAELTATMARWYATDTRSTCSARSADSRAVAAERWRVKCSASLLIAMVGVRPYAWFGRSGGMPHQESQGLVIGTSAICSNAQYDADKSAVLLIAEEIDKLGSRVDAQPAFNFFRGASTELCSAIMDKQNPKRSGVLQLHLKRIDDRRLRRAFAAAIEFDETFETVTTANKIRKRGSLDLWDGLRS